MHANHEGRCERGENQGANDPAYKEGATFRFGFYEQFRQYRRNNEEEKTPQDIADDQENHAGHPFSRLLHRLGYTVAQPRGGGTGVLLPGVLLGAGVLLRGILLGAGVRRILLGAGVRRVLLGGILLRAGVRRVLLGGILLRAGVRRVLLLCGLRLVLRGRSLLAGGWRLPRLR
ncbi:hypothetical protein [Arthrobacter sp. zg-Y769]|uniref:hypothetical protein n=1 Tax=Arthrobacter sp. zg-Y769 TaxID=2894191 RepID=UPI001E5CDA42|nr:hypothetical protein [Arthrobacter sp. zg-Y769]MCC9205096.1 hypothetical protein [Arthrobacter sp. zg-Y769]